MKDAEAVGWAQALNLGNALFKNVPDGGVFYFAGSDQMLIKKGNRYRRTDSMTFYKTGQRTAVLVRIKQGEVDR
ncbi:hypothetical protein [Bradyrhizobium sp. SZCCHNS3053]|uniref:hypothetical protein n=1 Tax=Bradyrhizobium sp. SZCCHNS3053 TaxID=3057322 RepID=UPI002916BB11|nr:hypothetical protein [Bradyrhizobium sp. SZCCHNS3053]